MIETRKANHYNLREHLIEARWTQVGPTFQTRAAAEVFERRYLATNRAHSGYTRIMPAANHRWVVEVDAAGKYEGR